MTAAKSDDKDERYTTQWIQVGWGQIEKRRLANGDTYSVIGSVSDERTEHHTEAVYITAIGTVPECGTLSLTETVDALKGLYGLLQLRNSSDRGWESNHRAVEARRVMALAEAHGTAPVSAVDGTTTEMCGRIGPACDTPGCTYTASGHCKLEQRAVSTREPFAMVGYDMDDHERVVAECPKCHWQAPITITREQLLATSRSTSGARDEFLEECARTPLMREVMHERDIAIGAVKNCLGWADGIRENTKDEASRTVAAWIVDHCRAVLSASGRGSNG